MDGLVRELKMDDVVDIKAGKMNWAGIRYKIEKNGVEKIIVRVRKSKKSWFQQGTFEIKSDDDIQRALDYFNNHMRDKVRYQLISKNKHNAVMKMPLGDLIDQCVDVMYSREVEPWCEKDEITVYKQIKWLKRFGNRFYKLNSDPTREESAARILVNQILDKKSQGGDINSLLQEYEKQVKQDCLIRNLTLERVKEIADSAQSKNGFGILIKNICFTNSTIKSTSLTVREFLGWVQTRYDKDKSVTGWLPTSVEDYKNLKPIKDNSTKRDVERYYTPEERARIIEQWNKSIHEFNKPNGNYNYGYLLAFKLGSACGPRGGEVFSLTPSDIDFTRNTINISNTVTLDIHGKRTLGNETKNGTTRDTLEIEPLTISEIKDWIQKNKIRPNDLIFTNKCGGIVSLWSFNRTLRSICSKCNVPYLPSHLSLRKTFINNAPDVILQESGELDKEKVFKAVADSCGNNLEVFKKNYFVQKAIEKSIANRATRNLFAVKSKSQEEQIRSLIKVALDAGNIDEVIKLSSELKKITLTNINSRSRRVRVA